MLSKLTLVIPIWKSKGTIQQEEKALELDISVTQIPVQNGRLGTGHAKNGKSFSCIIGFWYI